jgi:hypothetical protein
MVVEGIREPEKPPTSRRTRWWWWRGGGGVLEAREATNEPSRLIGGGGGVLEAKEATNESSYSLVVVEGCWRGAGSQRSHQ